MGSSLNARVATIVAVTAFAMGPLAPAAHARGGGREACRPDVEKLCPDAKPGDGSVRACLHDHEADLSDGCKQAMAHWKEHHGHHPHDGSGTNPSGGNSGTAPSGGEQHESTGGD
jgi:hypothetical protein